MCVTQKEEYPQYKRADRLCPLCVAAPTGFALSAAFQSYFKWLTNFYLRISSLAALFDSFLLPSLQSGQSA
jgi:hypothetical protein